MKFPSETSAAFQFGVGDKYFFTDINLPDTYKTDAENKLLAEGNKAITEYSQPQVQYGLSIDEKFYTSVRRRTDRSKPFCRRRLYPSGR